jgi:hypothetical protein
MTMPTLWIFALIALGIPVIFFVLVMVHYAQDRVCVRHARRFCRKNQLEIDRIRFQPARDPSGIRTEFTLIQVDCQDIEKQRKLIVLLVWPFGVRKILSNEKYPDHYEEKWP